MRQIASHASTIYNCRKAASDPTRWRPEDWQAIPETEPFILASGAGEAVLQTRVRAVWDWMGAASHVLV